MLRGWWRVRLRLSGSPAFLKKTSAGAAGSRAIDAPSDAFNSSVICANAGPYSSFATAKIVDLGPWEGDFMPSSRFHTFELVWQHERGDNATLRVLWTHAATHAPHAPPRRPVVVGARARARASTSASMAVRAWE